MLKLNLMAKQKGLRPEDVAYHTRLSYDTVVAHYSGRRKPSGSAAAAYVKLFECSYDDVFDTKQYDEHGHEIEKH